jgi:hypothetical protein
LALPSLKMAKNNGKTANGSGSSSAKPSPETTAAATLVRLQEAIQRNLKLN